MGKILPMLPEISARRLLGFFYGHESKVEEATLHVVKAIVFKQEKVVQLTTRCLAVESFYSARQIRSSEIRQAHLCPGAFVAGDFGIYRDVWKRLLRNNVEIYSLYYNIGNWSNIDRQSICLPG